MAVTFYSSDDAGAIQPTHSGSSGSYQTNIIEILDSILISGYGSKAGLGWTKVMTSELAGSDRTIYSNQSAYESNCHLLAESHKNYNGYCKFQVADTVTSPEVYSGYSHVGMGYILSKKWMAVGDERTLILIFYPDNMYSGNSSSFNSYAPQVLYFGDYDRQSNLTHKGWGLITPTMKAGTLDSVTSSGSTAGFFLSSLIQYDGYDTKACRPVTQLPGKEWSEDSVYACLTTLMPRPGNTSAEGDTADPGMAETPELFEQRAQISVPWFLILNRIFVYRLRGIFNIYPSLMHNDPSGKANMLKLLNVDGIDYLGTKQYSDRYDGYPMTAYIQVSGEWS